LSYPIPPGCQGWTISYRNQRFGALALRYEQTIRTVSRVFSVYKKGGRQTESLHGDALFYVLLSAAIAYDANPATRLSAALCAFGICCSTGASLWRADASE
jgi:hypothetical protein